MGQIRVLIADDHAVLRSGVSMLLNAQPDMVVVGEAGTGDETVARAEETAPDVLLLDITMPGPSGLDVIRTLRGRRLPMSILVLTMHEDEGHLIKALRAGASGYIPKRAADSELVAAIRAVHRGEAYVHTSLIRAVVEEMMHGEAARAGSGTAEQENLSQRESEVVGMVAEGYANRQIADRLHLSVKTVESYKARAMEKLGLRSRVELVRYALQRGLLGPEGGQRASD
jgi:two-component system response regulator NreC